MNQIRCMAFLLLVLALSTNAAWGQASPRSITVIGNAEKDLAPDHYQIAVTVKANGKTMAIASDDYRKKLENVRTVFNEMDFPEVKVVSKGKLLSDSPLVDPNEMQIMMIDGQDPTQQDKGFFIQERLVLEWHPAAEANLADVESNIHGLLDRIKAEKLSFASNSTPNYYQISNLVVGAHSQLAKEEKLLRTAAFADAKAQAEELAALAGCKIGKVVEIEVESPIESSSDFEPPMYNAYSVVAESANTCQLGKKIRLKSILKVRFELE